MGACLARPFPTKIKHAKYMCILCNAHRPIPVLVAKVWQRKLDHAKNLQAKYFTGENILIYGISNDFYIHYYAIYMYTYHIAKFSLDKNFA